MARGGPGLAVDPGADGAAEGLEVGVAQRGLRERAPGAWLAGPALGVAAGLARHAAAAARGVVRHEAGGARGAAVFGIGGRVAGVAVGVDLHRAAGAGARRGANGGELGSDHHMHAASGKGVIQGVF